MRSEIRFCRLKIEVRLLVLAPLLELHFEFLQHAQEYVGIVHLSHRILIIVHLAGMVLRISWQERLDRLDHVAQFLEGNTDPVNAVRIPGIQLVEPRQRLRVCAVNGLQDLPGKIRVVRVLPDGLADLLDVRLQVRRL